MIQLMKNIFKHHYLKLKNPREMEFENALKQEAKQNYNIKIIRGSNKALDNLELITKGKKSKNGR